MVARTRLVAGTLSYSGHSGRGVGIAAVTESGFVSKGLNETGQCIHVSTIPAYAKILQLEMQRPMDMAVEFSYSWKP